MNTGISSVSKLEEMGAIYPFAGIEWAYALIALGFTLFFIVKQIEMDKEESEPSGTVSAASPASMAAAE